MSVSVGSKDEQKSIFGFWQQVFQMPRQTGYVGNLYVYVYVCTFQLDLSTISCKILLRFFKQVKVTEMQLLHSRNKSIY